MHPTDMFMFGEIGIGTICGNLPPGVALYPTVSGGPQVAYLYSQLWQWDLGSNSWYKFRDKGPYTDILAAYGGGGPEAPDVIAKNPPWRYELIWYWTVNQTWKQYAEAYSWNVGDTPAGMYNDLYC